MDLDGPTTSTANQTASAPVRPSAPARVPAPVRPSAPARVPAPVRPSAPARVPAPVRPSAPARVPAPVRPSAPARVPAPVRPSAPVQNAVQVPVSMITPGMCRKRQAAALPSTSPEEISNQLRTCNSSTDIAALPYPAYMTVLWQ